MGVLWPADNVEQQHCWWRWGMSHVSFLLRLSQHFTQAFLSSLWELWLNNNNQSIPSICDLQNTAFSLLWPPRLLDCRTARCGEVESSDGGLAHDGMHISVMSKLPGGYLTSSDCWWVEHSGLQTLEGHWPHVSPTERRSQSLAKT